MNTLRWLPILLCSTWLTWDATAEPAPTPPPAPPQATTPAPSPPETVLGQATGEAGAVKVLLKQAAGYRSLLALVTANGVTRPVELYSPVEGQPEVRLVDLNADLVPDLLLDPGGTEPLVRRVALYVSRADRDGTATLEGPDPFVWRWLQDAQSLDDVLAKLQAIPRVDFSIPEVCGLLERTRQPVAESWETPEDRWQRSKRKLTPGWTCSGLVPDGPGYWLPEMTCSRIAPACSLESISGGHAGTPLPINRQVFFERVRGRLELKAVAVGTF